MAELRLRQIALVARLALALVFLWHGLVPKILWLSPDEVAMIVAYGLPAHGLPAPELIAQAAGGAEIVLALLLAGSVLLVLLVDVALFSPHLLLQAFNPLSTNLAALALCWVAWRAESAPAGETQPH